MNAHPENVVSLHPYFKVHQGQLETFGRLLPQFVEKTTSEENCLYYDFTIDDDVIFCREAYAGAEGVLNHLDNVGELLGKALEISDLIRIEVHGSTANLEKLKEPMGGLNPDWFVFQCGVEK